VDLPSISPAAGLSIAAIFATIGAFWQQSKSFARYLSGFLLLQKSMRGELAAEVGRHIRGFYRKAPSGVSSYAALVKQIDDRSISSLVPFEMPNTVSIWWGRRGIFLVNASSGGLTLLSIRWLSNPEALVIDALEESYARRQSASNLGTGSFFVERVLGTAGDSVSMMSRNRNLASSTSSADSPPVQDGSAANDWSMPDELVDRSFMYTPERYIQNRKTRGPFHGLFFDEKVSEMIEDVKQWFSRESWYREHGIPWRTGILLHGPGGTGKSSLSRALAQMLGVPLYQFYLNTLTDREFLERWDSMHAPCVVALEDFDTVFHGREPVTIHKSLSFECVLNAISGISSANGILLVVTTNHLDKIDPALGQLDDRGRPTRPGRIDHIVHMGVTSVQQRQDIARFTLNGWADDLVDALVTEGSDTTAAQFQFMCITAALDRLTLDSEGNKS